MKLHIVEDTSESLSRDALQERGNALVTDARRAALTAIALSMQPEYVERGHSIQRPDLLRWRARAVAARDEWQKVIDATTELLDEMKRTASGPKEQEAGHV